MQVSTAGAWRVHSGTVVTEEGVTTGTVIGCSSGDQSDEWFVPYQGEDLAPLIIALMDHLGISKVTSVAEPQHGHDHSDGSDHGHTH